MMQKRGSLVLIGGGVLLVTGCAQQIEPPVRPPAEVIAVAKSATQDAEQRLVRLAPDDLAQGLDQHPTGSLVDCGAGKQWAGHATIRLGPDADPASVVDAIERAAVQRDWRPARDTTASGVSRLRLQSRDGTSLLIRPDSAGSVNIASFSECFSLPDDFVPAPSY